MIIGTMNIQNKFYLQKYNGTTKYGNNAILLKEFLKKYNVSILGTQEFVIWYLNNLKKVLPKEYKIIGDFRIYSPFFKRYNETNSIITNQTIIKETTKKLPFLPSLLPRIVTICYLNTKEFGTICFINTHLSFEKNQKLHKKQLQTIIHAIKESTAPIILTGDFNMTINNQVMKEFIKELETLHIKRVPIFEKTYKKHKKDYAIDHIFLSDFFKIKRKSVIKEKQLEHFSDHYPILVEITKKESKQIKL